MTIPVVSFVVGVIAGLRAMTAPAAVSWAGSLDAVRPRRTRLAFMNGPYARSILTVAALGELVVDQLPSTPSRRVPIQFGARIVSGALSGAAIGAIARASWPACAMAGGFGAVLGTLGGSAVRSRLASAFGKDRPAALLEDAVAIGGAALVLGARR